uniref:Gypsy retrotransposon integrase-like protein 1 n=1 Tax=Stegastes partitus TaxID=144197 RepID=A0A3B4ZKQ1_9TELE
MADVDLFIAAPSEEALKKLKKEQLLRLVEHYDVDVPEKSRRDDIEAALRSSLVEQGFICQNEQVKGAAAEPFKFSVQTHGLTFEQQKELLLLQLEHDRTKHESEIRQNIEIEKIRQQIEREKLEVEGYRLSLKPDSGNRRQVLKPELQSFDVSNLRWLPPFNEKDPDTFFSLFERVCKVKEWSDKECALLLQCVLTGKAQEAYSCLSVDDSFVYKKIKSAVLKAYELVPEAYRQRFRSWDKTSDQTYVEYVRDLQTHFKRWITALNVSTFDDLCELIVLEQFKNVLPDRIATYINERDVSTAADAAVSADEFVLIHRDRFGERPVPPFDAGWRARGAAAEVRRSRKVGQFGSDTKARRQFDFNTTCNYCRERGHWKADCPALKARNQVGEPVVKPAALAVPVNSVGVPEERGFAPSEPGVLAAYAPFIRDGFVSLVGSRDKVPIKILRDTGAYDSYIVGSVLPLTAASDTGDRILSRGMGLTVLPIPLHRIVLTCELVQGEVTVGVRPALPIEGVHFILGNGLAGSQVWTRDPPVPVDHSSAVFSEGCGLVSEVFSTCPPVVSPCPLELNEGSGESPDVFSACVVTRAMSKTQQTKEVECDVPSLSEIPLSVSYDELLQEQQNDPSLKRLFELVLPDTEVGNVASGYFLENKLLFRKWVSFSVDVMQSAVFQLVIPVKLRPLVLKTAHDEGGHFGVKKTYSAVLRHFFWPGLRRDVSSYIRTCHVCQVTGKPNQTISPAPLQPIPAVSEPFGHLLVDCVGPLPGSKSGSRYLLTVMCQTTRYPAAYPLRSITTKNVVKALSQFISVFGIPKVIQSDQGSNFSSHMFAQVLKLLRVKHNQSSAYHAQSQSALERFHQTLKPLLRAYCTELDRDWEEGLPWLLLAAREAVQESTGFSPNDLVFGHSVRGPLSVLKDSWVKAEPPKNLIDYVNGFRHRLVIAGGMAREKLRVSQDTMKNIYDRHTERHEFSPGDQVLMLRPVVGSPFQAKYTGPCTVAEKISDLNYLIETPGRRKSSQLCHVNLLKPYYQRASDGCIDGVVRPILVVDSVSPGYEHDGIPEPDDTLLYGRLKNSETLRNLDKLLSHLSLPQQKELTTVIHCYPALFGDVPSRTTWLQHDIDVGDARPIKQRFYRMSPAKLKHLDDEINYMLQNDIAVPSCSSWASPCILVPKQDKSPRFCTDLRKVNSVTKTDSFPLPRMDDCIDQVGSAKFVSKLDLLKGYWQVPLSQRAQEISAFVTPSGL